jgi:hypothetical protein
MRAFGTWIVTTWIVQPTKPFNSSRFHLILSENMMVKIEDVVRDTGGVAAKAIRTTTNTRMSIKSDIITSVAKSIPMILHLFQWLDLLILQFLALLIDLLPSLPTSPVKPPLQSQLSSQPSTLSLSFVL